MTKSRIREKLGNLKNQPLVEAIFELGWTVEGISPEDQLWEVLPGLYYGSIKDEYPQIESLPASQVPVQLTQNIIRHRFRKGKGAWPLTQLGPGILTVNETTGYTVWEDFLPRITTAVESLTRVSPNHIDISRTELRYINAIPFDETNEKIIDFLNEKLHLQVELPTLYDGESEVNEVTNANIMFHMPLKRPSGIGEIMAALGTKDDDPAVIFHLVVRSVKDDAPTDCAELQVWAESAHEIIDAWFLRLCEGNLIESFRE